MTVVTAERTEAVTMLSLTGEIVARDTMSASFPTGGRIAEVLVDDGERAAEGAVLARIEQVQQEQALRAAEAGLASARASLDQARDEEDRLSELFERGAITRSARDAAADRYTAAVAVEAQARAELDRAGTALADCVIVAPADATVTQRLAEPGQVVGAGQPVLELALGDGYDAVFDVPEIALATSAPGEPPDIRLAPLDRPEEFVRGTVAEVSPVIDSATGTIEVRIAMDAPLAGLSFGDPVRGSAIQSAGEGIELPWSAITATADGPAVWIVDPATRSVSLRQVTLRRYESGKFVLESGVEPGEQVVSLGAQLLYPGRTVRADGG